MSSARAIRYRRLALAEPDQDNARLLRLLADEDDRGVLVTADWLKPRSPEPSHPIPSINHNYVGGYTVPVR
jgi:hypothetical protein